MNRPSSGAKAAATLISRSLCTTLHSAGGLAGISEMPRETGCGGIISAAPYSPRSSRRPYSSSHRKHPSHCSSPSSTPPSSLSPSKSEKVPMVGGAAGPCRTGGGCARRTVSWPVRAAPPPVSGRFALSGNARTRPGTAVACEQIVHSWTPSPGRMQASWQQARGWRSRVTWLCRVGPLRRDVDVQRARAAEEELAQVVARREHEDVGRQLLACPHGRCWRS